MYAIDHSDLGNPAPPIVFIVSGGVGASAEQLVQTILAQFPDNRIIVRMEVNLRRPDQIDSMLVKAQGQGALVVHTLVASDLRFRLIERAHDLGVQEVDLVGPTVNWMSTHLGQSPIERPGLYRLLNRNYFERVAAIDFTMAHDDGKNLEDWEQAELVLIGVSRVGKTPLSLYLAVLGLKVANLPLIPTVSVSYSSLSRFRERIVGLTIDAAQLIIFRRKRQARLGVGGASTYVDLESVQEEIRAAKHLFSQLGVAVIDMTDKTIELAADEILKLIPPYQAKALF